MPKAIPNIIPPKTMIPYGKQDINDDDIKTVIDVLKSDWLTQGPKVPEFEQVIKQFCQVDYAVATNSATSALHLACLALEVKSGDIVWTSPVSFVASSNCALYCGASIDFVDIDLSTGNISVSLLKQKLYEANLKSHLPKVIIAVHLAGQSCNMQAIKLLADKYNITLIEDASHAVGANYKNRPVGCCQFSDITIFSFHPVKIITSAEGGMALTNCSSLARKMQLLRSHGITSSPAEMDQTSHGPWYYQQIMLGFNYRMTDLQAALGVSQLKRLSEFVKQRNVLAKNYERAFEHSALTCLTPKPDTYSAYHLYIVLLPTIDKKTHKQTIEKLREKNICAHVHYIPIHLQPYYQNLGFNKGDFPVAEEYYSRAISLPLFPKLTASEQQYIIEILLELVQP